MRVLWVIFVGIVQVTSFLVIKKLALNLNPKFGTGVAVIDKLPNGMPTVTIDINFTKTLNGKVQVASRLQYVEGKIKKSGIRVPTINYCDMMRGQILPIQLVQVFIDQISKFGRVVVPCPVQPGHYYIKNAYIDETQLPIYRLLREEYLVILEVVLKQEISGKMVKIYDLRAHFTCNQSNWP